MQRCAMLLSAERPMAQYCISPKLSSRPDNNVFLAWISAGMWSGAILRKRGGRAGACMHMMHLTAHGMQTRRGSPSGKSHQVGQVRLDCDGQANTRAHLTHLGPWRLRNSSTARARQCTLNLFVQQRDGLLRL